MSMAKEGEGGEVSAESGAMSDRAAYRDVALRAAWGGNETGADFGPAWKYLTVHPELVNDQDEEGRGILHCCCVLPEDSDRNARISTLIAIGADIEMEDKYGWKPSSSDFVVDIKRKWENWNTRFLSKNLQFFLQDSTGNLNDERIYQCLWLYITRYNINEKFDLNDELKGQTPLHMMVRCLSSLLKADSRMPHIHLLTGKKAKILEERCNKWSAKRALLLYRKKYEEQEKSVEKWTPVHDLLCLILDLGADAEVVDAEGHSAAHYCTSKLVRSFLESDWELGENTKAGFAVTDAGDIVDAQGFVIQEQGVNDAPEQSNDIEQITNGIGDISLNLTASGLEEEGIYKRVERAETEMRAWRSINRKSLEAKVQKWPYEDALDKMIDNYESQYEPEYEREYEEC